MSGYLYQDVQKVTTNILQRMRDQNEKIAMLTAYDYSLAKLLDMAKIDVILVGDSAANVMAGYKTTLPITLDAMIYHAASVVRAVERALVVVDLPFGTYQGNSKEALHSAIRIMKESGADAIKLEGGEEIRESIERIICAGIPVMGHLGLTPQSINKFGTYAVRATEDEEAEKLLYDAQQLESRQKGDRSGACSHHRHRSRQRHQRTGAGAARHARHHPAVLPAFPEKIPQPQRGNHPRGGQLH